MPRRVLRSGDSQCAALIPSRAHGRIWFRCRRAVARRDIFCSRHRDSLDGAILGWIGCQNASLFGSSIHETVPQKAHDHVQEKTTIRN